MSTRAAKAAEDAAKALDEKTGASEKAAAAADAAKAKAHELDEKTGASEKAAAAAAAAKAKAQELDEQTGASEKAAAAAAAAKAKAHELDEKHHLSESAAAGAAAAKAKAAELDEQTGASEKAAAAAAAAKAKALEVDAQLGAAIGPTAEEGIPLVADVRSFAENPALSEALGKAVAEVAAAAPADKPFTVAISGGSLPKLLAAGILAVEGVDYSNWHVFFADERVVPLEDDDSNYKACDEVFFSKAGIARERVYTVDASLTAEEAAAAYTTQLQAVFGAEGTPAFDLVLLGMGPDGHTASLFPGHALLEVADRWVAHIEDSPKPPPKRITLTYPVLNAAKAVYFVCTGAGKAPNLAVALGASEGSVPAGEVKPASGNLVWFVDDAASAEYREKTGL